MVYVLHENDDWVRPLFKTLDAINIPYVSWFVVSGGFDPQMQPPEGIFYSRISASSHTRGHDGSIDLALPLVQWLEAFDRRVVNGKQTIATEISKARQQILLNSAGIPTPKTYIANNPGQLVPLSEYFMGKPFIVKPNRGGKGLGVQLFESKDSLQLQIENNPEFISPDGIFILQEYIKPANEEIIRMEFIGGKLFYSVSVNTSEGFELCPADGCEIVGNGSLKEEPKAPKFRILDDSPYQHLARLESFLQKQEIDIAGVEFVTDHLGNQFVYDINTNTNYNREAEEATGFRYEGMMAVARFLEKLLVTEYATS